MEKLINDFSFGLFFWIAVLFITLIFLLKKFAWSPILKALDEREDGIRTSLEEAKTAREEMQASETRNKEILAEARLERDAMLKEAREIKESIIAKAKDTANAEGARMIENAKEAIEIERQAAITSMKNEIGKVSIDIAENILKRELSDKDAQAKHVSSLIETINLQ